MPTKTSSAVFSILKEKGRSGSDDKTDVTTITTPTADIVANPTAATGAAANLALATDMMVAQTLAQTRLG